MIAPSAISAAALLMAALAVQPPAQPGGDCLPVMDLAQKSFARVEGLGLKFTFVWIDDIGTTLVGGYDPFDMFVVTGRIYSPFEMPNGRLERAAFERLSAPSRNIERFGPLRVPASFSRQRPPTLRFVYGGSRYQVRTIAVKPSRFGDDQVAIQVCREGSRSSAYPNLNPNSSQSRGTLSKSNSMPYSAASAWMAAGFGRSPDISSSESHWK
jgi:hypothetical protein